MMPISRRINSDKDQLDETGDRMKEPAMRPEWRPSDIMLDMTGGSGGRERLAIFMMFGGSLRPLLPVTGEGSTLRSSDGS